jgi:hypothetical protein
MILMKKNMKKPKKEEKGKRIQINLEKIKDKEEEKIKCIRNSVRIS